MIHELFHRAIDVGDDLIEVVRAEGSAHVSIYSGPFCWQIDVHDLQAVLRMLAHVVAKPTGALPPYVLRNGHALTVGVGLERTHCWISAAHAHLRLPLHALDALVAALSEARAHVTRRVDAARAAGEGAPA